MRGQRSLVNTFPFNTQEHQHGDHHAHADHHGEHADHADHADTSASSFSRNELTNRGSRQVIDSTIIGFKF